METKLSQFANFLSVVVYHAHDCQAAIRYEDYKTYEESDDPWSADRAMDLCDFHEEMKFGAEKRYLGE